MALRNQSSRSGGIAFKLGLAQIITAAIAIVAVAALVAVYRVTEAELATLQAHSDQQLELATALESSRKDVEIDIIQIQQYLQDVSATRLVDGLGADDWTIAADYAGRFQKDAGAARAVAVKLKDERLVAVLDKMQADFPAYYKMGMAMAKAYVKDGPLGGNAAMPQFDATADAMRGALRSADERIAAIRNATASERAAVAVLRQSSARTMLILGAILVVLVIVVSVLIMRFVQSGLIRPLKHATGVLGDMAAGKQDVAIESLDANGEMGTLVEALLSVRRAAQEKYQAERAAEAKVVGAVGAGLHALAKGDLTYRISDEISAAFAALRDDFNAAAARLHETLKTVSATTGEVSSNASDISQWTDELAQRTERQAASLEETAAALQEITATVSQSAAHAKEARGIVAGAKEAAEKGGTIVGSAVDAMHEIEASSKKISDIAGVIDEIAFQTNLLALNAGVEAARAGESGKGFAVVASEVRALAQRCATAAREVKTLISESQKHVDSGVSLVGNSGSALGEILDQVSRIDVLVDEMANASEQQSSGIKQISSAVSDMDSVTQKNAAMVQQNKEVARSLTQQTGELASMVGFFDVGAAAVSHQPVPHRRRSAA